ncbi:transposase [Kitasatospora sp. NPDC059327]|uniref:transposase n=1 Tax=Kitasatospora sp. NPDC059327 TaxID=3346803 RepID=UPI0036A045AA
MTERRRYPSDLKDDQWQFIEPTLLRWRAARGEGREPTTGLREVVNAILYVARTGIAWRYLPHDFPPHTTVYGYFKVRHEALFDRAEVEDLRHRAVAAA